MFQEVDNGQRQPFNDTPTQVVDHSNRPIHYMGSDTTRPYVILFLNCYASHVAE